MTQPLRIDKWLWHARFFKSRTLAAKFISEGKLRINQTRISKPSRLVELGEVLTFVKAEHPQIIQVDAYGTRRGPAPEARTLYTDLSPPKTTNITPSLNAHAGGRPSKQDRRKFDAEKRKFDHGL